MFKEFIFAYRIFGFNFEKKTLFKQLKMCFSIEKTKEVFFREIQQGSCKVHPSKKNQKLICIEEKCPSLAILCEECKACKEKKEHDHPPESFKDLSLINISQLFESIQTVLKDINKYPREYSILLRYQNDFFRESKKFCEVKNLKAFAKIYLKLREALINRFEQIKKDWNVQLQSASLSSPLEFDPATNTLKIHNIVWTERPIDYYIDESVKERENLEKLIETALEEFQRCTNLINLFKKMDKVDEPWRCTFRHVNFVCNLTEYDNYATPRGDKDNDISFISLSKKVQKRHILHEIMHVLGFSHEHERNDNPNLKKGDYKNENAYFLTDYDKDSIMQYKHNWGECAEKLSEGDIEAVQMIYGQPLLACNFDPERKADCVNFECIDCWGENTDIAICFFCRISHHRNHKVIKHKRDQYFCDCGRFEHQPNLCTKILTESENKNFCKQNLFKCLNCKQNEEGDYVCIACAKNCHAAHETVMIKEKNGVCKCKCKVVKEMIEEKKEVCNCKVVKDTPPDLYCKLI